MMINMKKIIISIILVGMLLIPPPPGLGLGGWSLHQTIYVDDDNIQGPWYGTLEHPYQHVQDGLNYSSSLISSSINLIGENKHTTIIDGGKSGDVVQIYADRVRISGFTIQNGNGYGIVLKSTDNIILDNIIKMNIKDIKDNNEDNLFSSNLFLYNAQTSLITFDTDGIKKNLNEEVSFSVSMFNVNGDPFYSDDYNIYIRPAEPLSISKYGNTITGSFTVTKSGIYSLIVEIKDMNNSRQ